MFNEWFGMHYGAGIGVGIVQGQILRTSNVAGCTEANAGDLTQCHPGARRCTGASCELPPPAPPGPDSVTTRTASRTRTCRPCSRSSTPWSASTSACRRCAAGKAKIEGGFYNAFFLGGGVGYTF